MQKYLRFIFGLRKYFKNSIDTVQAIHKANKLLHERMSKRDGNFLQLVNKGIYGYSRSPYKKLLNTKKISFNDIKKLVENDGIENTLWLLYNEGIYFTVDEFKGKTNVIRDGLKYHVEEGDFDNPFLKTAYEVRSGATRSAGTRIRIDFDYLTQRSYYDAFILNLHDCLTSPIANWFPIFPGAPGINSSLRFARIGNAPKKWFSQVETSKLKVNWEKRWGTKYIFFMSKLMGINLASPEYANLNYAFKVAEWASSMLDYFPSCVVYTFASSAVRICMAAEENGLNLKGARFLVTGEPLTAQKRREIESVGATPVPIYGISEAGVIASGCTHEYPESDHCHMLKDTIAIISHRYRVPHFDNEVDAFLFSTVLYESPKLLLNVGMGDFGTIYTKKCDCPFGKMGFNQHIADIRSFEKLTGEGVTFVDTDFIHIIENELPKKFGGQSADYQLIEEEDEKGLTHLKLLISPRLEDINEREVIDTFVRLLKKSEHSPESWSQSGSEMWIQARTIRVKREYPIPTKSAKILPFHILKQNL